MTSLTKDTPQEWESYAGEHNARLTIAAGEAQMYAGQLVCYGASAEQIKHPDNDEADNFAGILQSGGVAGDVVEVRQVGLLVATVAGTFAAQSEGTAAYGDTSTTADNSVAAITHTSTSNLPIGKIQRVITAGAGAKGVFLIQADGFR